MEVQIKRKIKGSCRHLKENKTQQIY